MSRKIKKRPAKRSRFSPQQLESLFQKAFDLHQNGHLNEAKKKYRIIVGQIPDHSQTLNLLGLISQAEGDYKRAVQLATKAVSSASTAQFLSNLGSAHRGNGAKKKAISAFKRALANDPTLFEAQFNLAGTLLECGKTTEAEIFFRKVVNRQPEMTEALLGLCQACHNQGKYAEVLELANKIIQLTPGLASGHLQKGMALLALQKLNQARSAYEKAYELDKTQDVALNNIGNILSQQGKLHQALSFYKRAVDLQPNSVEASINLAWTYGQHGMLNEAASCFREIIKKRPEQYHIYSDFLFTSNYNPDISPQQHLDAAKQWWQYHLKAEGNIPKTPPASTEKKAPLAGSKLKIGFLSPDFCHHPVGMFLLPLVQELTKHDFQLFCYAEMATAKYDPITEQIQKISQKWRSTWHKSCEEVVSQIKCDDLDVLVDLAGHSAFNRLDIMAAKPTAIQVEWLGYVNTTGLPTIDYRLCDNITDPPGSDKYYSEKLVRLPHGFFCYHPPEKAPEVNKAPILTKGTPTFGSLNNLAKITPAVIEIWAEILMKSPKSRLLMVSRALSDKFIQEKYRNLFKEHGIETNRIDMISTLPMQEYLEIYHKIDIGLDPFPHNGHTITCHTLWMGVPVVCLRGDRYAGRMGASIMTRVGLEKMIAEDKRQYVEIATRLASSPETVGQLRDGMRERILASDMCNKSMFAADFTTALLAMLNNAAN